MEAAPLVLQGVVTAGAGAAGVDCSGAEGYSSGDDGDVGGWYAGGDSGEDSAGGVDAAGVDSGAYSRTQRKLPRNSTDYIGETYHPLMSLLPAPIAISCRLVLWGGHIRYATFAVEHIQQVRKQGWKTGQ